MITFTLTSEFETRIYNLVDGIIQNITFAKEYMLVTTDIDNYKTMWTYQIKCQCLPFLDDLRHFNIKDDTLVIKQIKCP